MVCFAPQLEVKQLSSVVVLTPNMKSLLLLYAICLVSAQLSLAYYGATNDYDILSRCQYLPDGNYPLKPCSEWYLTCTAKRGIVSRCPSDLVYDPIRKQCDRRENVAACGGTTSTTPVSDVTSTTRSNSFDCMGLLPGNYPMTPTACMQQYFTCDADGIGVLRVCPNGLYFDPATKVCNFFANIIACTGPTTTPTTPATATVPTLPVVNFDCTYRPDGYYPNPRQPCSNTYYACVNREARELHCETGLVYDVLSNACQSPQNTYACTGRTTTPTRPPTTGTTPTLPIDCTFLPNGLYQNPQQMCSRIFFSCSDGIAERFQCPGSLYYDPVTKECQRFEDIFVCIGPTTTTTTTTTATTVTTPMSDIPFDCGGLPDGDYPNPAQLCSTFYYVCSGSVVSVQECPQGLYYDPEKNECNSFGNIYVCTGTRGTTTTTVTTAVTPTPPPGINCQMLGNGLFPNPTSLCSQTYYQCSNGDTYTRRCQNDLFFNPQLKICDRFSDIYECTGTRSTPSTTLSTMTTPNIIVPFDCSFLPNGNYRNPQAACSQIYYTCSNGKATQRNCPATTYFDSEMQECLDFDYVPACSGAPRTTTSITMTTPLSDLTTQFYDCSNRPNGNYPLGQCETVYVSCVDGDSVLRQCPQNLYYDATINECDYIYYIPSCGGQRTTTPMSDVTSPTTTAKPEFDCSQLPDGKYPNPNSLCFSPFYYVCTGGQTIKMYCPSNLVYDPYLMECRYIKNACKPYYRRKR